MNKIEAKSILINELANYRHRNYNDLLYLIKKQDTYEVRGNSGVSYQLEFYAIWDDKKQKNMRIVGNIDCKGFSAIYPLTSDFILSPDGTFLDE